MNRPCAVMTQDHRAIFEMAGMIVKVKEPLPRNIRCCGRRPDCFHLPAPGVRTAR